MRTENARGVVRALAAAGAGILALAVAGCGSSADQDTAAPERRSATASAPAPEPAPDPVPEPAPGVTPREVDLVAGTAEAAIRAGTAKVRVEVVSTSTGRTVTLTSEGVTDAANGSARLATSVRGTAADAVSIETIVVDGSVYVGGLPDQPSGTWVRVPLDRAQRLGLDASSSDPTQTLHLLRGVRGVRGDVADAGRGRFRGTEVTRYTGTIDVARALEAMPPAQAALAGPVFAAANLTAIPFELSLDGQGRPAQLRQRLALTAQGEPVLVETSVEFYDWGTKEAIAAPDPAQITDAPVPTV